MSVDICLRASLCIQINVMYVRMDDAVCCGKRFARDYCAIIQITEIDHQRFTHWRLKCLRTSYKTSVFTVYSRSSQSKIFLIYFYFFFSFQPLNHYHANSQSQTTEQLERPNGRTELRQCDWNMKRERDVKGEEEMESERWKEEHFAEYLRLAYRELWFDYILLFKSNRISI